MRIISPSPEDRSVSEIAPYTRESIQRAKRFQEEERLRACKDMGIPSDLLALYEVFGFEQMRVWNHLMTALQG